MLKVIISLRFDLKTSAKEAFLLTPYHTNIVSGKKLISGPTKICQNDQSLDQILKCVSLEYHMLIF